MKSPIWISANQAAVILGMDPRQVKQMIRSGVWKFGEIIPGRKIGTKRDRTIIWVAKLEDHIGRRLTDDEISAGIGSGRQVEAEQAAQ